jgi:hypothetical protein
LENGKGSAHAQRGSRRGPALIAAAGAALLLATWLYARTSPATAPTRAQPAAAPVAVDAAQRGEAVPSATPASFAAPPAASAVRAAASGPFLPPVESPAESLRKVQVALAGGTPQEDWAAAITLESCAHADKMANALMQSHDTMAQSPPEVKKMFEGLPPVSDEMIAHAQGDQRRCQVFDAPTLARRGELYQKAYEGGAEGSALSYLNWLRSEDGPKDKADPELIGRLQAAVRADAKAADFGALASFAFGGGFTAAQVAASPVEAQAYREAYFRIVGETSPEGAASSRALVARLSVFGSKQPALTPEQQSQADALTSQVVDAWHHRKYKGG